jgi:cytochrome c biogenesis protein CcmG/thiol:disulfide interchange protein DsbE
VKNRWGFILLIVVTVTFTIYFGQSGKITSVDQKPEIGFQAPDFSLESLNFDQAFNLQDLDKPVVINFWASWCQPCRLEAPDLVELYEEYSNDVEIYAINLTDSDNIRSAESFVEEFGFEFPVLLDKDGTVGSAYQVLAIPTTYFINADGIIENKIVGYAPKSDLESNFRNLARK